MKSIKEIKSKINPKEGNLHKRSFDSSNKSDESDFSPILSDSLIKKIEKTRVQAIQSKTLFTNLSKSSIDFQEIADVRPTQRKLSKDSIISNVAPKTQTQLKAIPKKKSVDFGLAKIKDLIPFNSSSMNDMQPGLAKNETDNQVKNGKHRIRDVTFTIPDGTPRIHITTNTNNFNKENQENIAHKPSKIPVQNKKAKTKLTTNNLAKRLIGFENIALNDLNNKKLDATSESTYLLLSPSPPTSTTPVNYFFFPKILNQNNSTQNKPKLGFDLLPNKPNSGKRLNEKLIELSGEDDIDELDLNNILYSDTPDLYNNFGEFYRTRLSQINEETSDKNSPMSYYSKWSAWSGVSSVLSDKDAKITINEKFINKHKLDRPIHQKQRNSYIAFERENAII